MDATKDSITDTFGAKDNAKDVTHEVGKKVPVVIDGKASSPT